MKCILVNRTDNSPIWCECKECGSQIHLESSFESVCETIKDEEDYRIYKACESAKTDPFYVELNYDSECPSCQAQISLITSLVVVDVSYHDIPSFPFDIHVIGFVSPQLKFTGFKFATLKGKTIRKWIHRMIGLWYLQDTNIFIVSPYINRSDVYEFAYIFWTNNWILSGHKNTKMYIFTRQWQKDLENFYNSRILSEKLKLLENELHQIGEVILRPGMKRFERGKMGPGKKAMWVKEEDFKEFYKKVKVYGFNNFHAKFYTATLPDDSVELIHTSYNYTEATAEQYETFSFQRITKDELMTVLSKFPYAGLGNP
jgi:hypothetical protein